MSLAIDLQGRKALVTGVTSGIGAGIAQQLAKAGCDVVGCGRSGADSDGAQAFLQSVRSEGRRCEYLATDLSDGEAAGSLVEAAAAFLGGIDVLVSNAGRNVFKGVSGCSDADWVECMELDLASHWKLAQASRTHLEKSDTGVVIVIGSNHAWNTMPGCFPYNVAKAGIVALVQSIAIEWGPRVRSVGVAPGFVDTAGNQTWFDSFEDAQKAREETVAKHPVGRLGSVEEIGSLCAFLASPMAGFISGTTLCVDGGRSALMQD